MRARSDTRGVSFPLTQVVLLAVVTVVVAGALVSAGDYLEGERQRAAHQQLESVGTDLASSLVAADRLADGERNTTLEMDVSSPARVAGGSYTVSLRRPAACPGTSPSVACVELSSPTTGVRRTIPFRNESRVREGTATGGGLRIVYRQGALTITDRP